MIRTDLALNSLFTCYFIKLFKSGSRFVIIQSSSLSRRKDGVCARVRIKIEQELVLTRDAFKAKLEIENGEKSDLENIKVEIQIKPTFGSDDIENDKFSIGNLYILNTLFVRDIA
jgi:hypothetical protein